MAEILNWTQERLQQEVAALDQALHEASHFPKKVREA
jgi:hypothetical protein